MNNDPLLQQLKAGNPGALKNLYTKYFNMLYAKAFSILEDEFLAKDLVQNCFMEIYEKKTYLQVHTSLQAFLMVVVRRHCYLHIRNQRRLQKRADLFNAIQLENQRREGAKNFLTRKIDEEEALERRSLIAHALNSLSPQERKVIKTVVVNGRTHKQAAQETGMNQHTLQTYIYRAFGKLKKYVSAS